MRNKMTTLLPFYYQNYYLKIGSNTVYLNKVVKVVIKIYTHERKRDNYPSIGGISKKNYYLNTPPPRKPKVGQKKVVMKNYYLKFSEFFSCPHRKIGQKKVVKCLTVIYLNLKRG